MWDSIKYQQQYRESMPSIGEAAAELADRVVSFRDEEVGDLVIEDPSCCGAWLSCEEPIEVEP